ncbi:uncharacterized protein LOC116842682 [Odontomachus brunneus]|uniref:uncharacterized protein LOC116842682 n=1 Tax=Odontomachus brunneus TaxID=486640 RepID=UPI0013F18A38|nr:uncharacterized protein LOC116842682 [Odontomachus brunneus]
MNVHIKSMMRCMKFQNNKKLPSNIEEGAENVTKIANSRVDKKNENSPKSSREYIAPNNHSTPIRQKPSSDNAEDLSNLDYSPNLILLPCTQDGGNEVAWDWQNTLNKTPNSRNKKQIVQSETPKGTKAFQRKRNSDSPLLCKPLKRKSIKMESIEHIGQFAAELQALNEKVRIIEENDLEDSIKEESSIVYRSNNEKVKSSVVDNKENCTVETNIICKRSASYDDLFDDSIDDSMARCTQEIEEKLNLIVVKGSSNVHSQSNIKKEKLSPTNNTTVQISATQSKESSVTTSTKNLFCGNTDGNSTLRMNTDRTSQINSDGRLKTYSKLSLKGDANSSVHVSTWKDKNLHKVCLNNNMVQCDSEKSSKDRVAELFDFPDDSFDDCLATCIEDDELLSTSIKSNGFLVPKFESNYKNLTHAPLKKKLFYNSTASNVKVETSTTGSLDNRKFFKSKSLSDQYIGQNSTANYKSTVQVTLPSYLAKTASRLNSTPKNPAVSHSTSTSVSTDSVPTSQCKIENNAISLIPSVDRMLGPDVNRSAIKESGNRFVKYNSTGNMRSDAKKTVTIDSLPARCTPEEIEKKRLQAMMRLKAKGKLRNENCALNIKNNINRFRTYPPAKTRRTYDMERILHTREKKIVDLLDIVVEIERRERRGEDNLL